MLAQLAGGQHAAAHRFEAVVVALGLAARIGLHRGLARWPVHTGPRRRGLHMPGAASLASTASRVARVSGSSSPLILLTGAPSSCR